MMDELGLLAEFLELWPRFWGFLREHWKVYVGFLVGLLVMILEILHIRKHKPPVNKKVQKARELGHVVLGTRVSYSYSHGDDSTSYHAKYTYEVDGAGYVYKYFDTQFPPLQLNLYYFNYPKRAFHEKESRVRSCLGIALFYLIPFMAFHVVTRLLGGIP